jgi:hypothetical protein
MATTDYSNVRTRTLTLRPILKMFFGRPEDKAWLESWARECGESPEKLGDPYAWISGRFYYGLYELIASRKTHDVESFREASLGIMSKENLGTLYTLARAFGSPGSTYERYATYLNSLQEVGEYRIEQMAGGRAVISFVPRQPLPCQDLDCAYRRGALEAIPPLWDLPESRGFPGRRERSWAPGYGWPWPPGDGSRRPGRWPAPLLCLGGPLGTWRRREPSSPGSWATLPA